MWKTLPYLFYFTAIALCFIHCATPVAPKGGPKDETPPKLDSLRSTPNFQTNFEKQLIEFTFDEWLRLDDVFNQVVVSPPLNDQPEISLRGKTVRVEFSEEEVLRENATYTINFGEAVKDLNEGNVAPDLRFVFSTGDKLDSLRVRGKLTDALTNEGAEGFLFLLYDNLSDTVVRTERPFYFAKTNAQGMFQVDNVKADTFKVFALEDKNSNYLFDLPGERIGFLDTFVIVSDTIEPFLQFKVFEEEGRLRMLESDQPHYGLVRLVFNRNPEEAVWTSEQTDQEFREEISGDTLKIWFHQPDTTNWNLFIQNEETSDDTIPVAAVARYRFLENGKFKPAQKAARGRVKDHNPDRDFELDFNHPLQTIDTAYIRLLEDSLKISVRPKILLDSTDIRKVKVSYEWKEEVTYEVLFLPGAFQSFYGMTHDTIQRSFQVGARKKYGNILLSVDSLDTSMSYVIEMFGKSDKLVGRWKVNNETNWNRELLAMEPGDYFIRIVEDLNNNGRWDPGDYDDKRQAERIFEKQLEQLRANWDVEAVISLSEFKEQ